jgi:hypothetical protein
MDPGSRPSSVGADHFLAHRGAAAAAGAPAAGTAVVTAVVTAAVETMVRASATRTRRGGQDVKRFINISPAKT